MLKPILNKGIDYVKNIMNCIGIKKFEELLVDGTGFTNRKKEKSVKDASDKIDNFIEEIWK